MSNETQWPYEFTFWPLDKLYVDRAYQRPLTSLVDRIVQSYDPRLLTPIIISVRKENMNGAVVDGQTRMMALRRLGHKKIPALSFTGTREEEAALFARFQLERRGIRPYHRHHAAVVAKDPAALEIEKIVKRYGYETMDLGSTVKAWGIQSIAALEKIHQHGLLDDVLLITSTAWRPPSAHNKSQYGKGHPLNNEVLRGLLSVLMKEPDLDRQRMARGLVKTTPQELTLRAGHLRQGRGMGGNSPSYMREVLLSIYKKAK